MADGPRIASHVGEPLHPYPPHLASRTGRAGAAADAWGAADPRERGPVIGTVTNPGDRNVIGAHGGSYALYRALAVSSGALNPIAPAGPHQHAPGGRRSARIRNGASPAASSRSTPGATWRGEVFATEIAEGIDIRPTIAITRARLDTARDRAGAVGAGG